MIGFFRGLVSALVTVAAVLFALGNRETVHLVWSPVNDPADVPLFVVGLGGLGIGFISGALLLWLRTLGWQFRVRRQKKQIEALEKDLHKKANAAAEAANSRALILDHQIGDLSAP